MQLLIVGDSANAAFRRPELKLHSDWKTSQANSFLELEQRVATASPPVDLVIAYQDRPKQLSQAAVLRCLATSPLLRIVLVLGPWCDGDLRTPGRLAGVQVLRFDQAKLRLADMIESFRQGKGPLAQPLTAALQENGNTTQKSKSLRVGLHLQGRLASGVSASLAALGHTAELMNEPNFDPASIDLLLVDGDAEDSHQMADNDLSVLKLQGFSRSDGDHSLAKLFSLAELDAALKNAMASP